MSVTSKACFIRDRLVSQFIVRSIRYNQFLAGELIKGMSMEKASAETNPFYQSYLEARRTLHDHQQEHGCSSD